MNLTGADLLAIARLGARGVARLKGKKFAGVSTDSRTVKKGELFVALHGEAYDGNRFVAKALEAGAAAAVVDSKAGFKAAGNRPAVLVKDTAVALGALAMIYRKKFAVPVIAVAGSNGKTTTKEMIANVLARKYTVLSTEGNLNNHVGVPATLFRLRPAHEVAVVEVGTNHFGEVKRLAATALPTHGLITNVAREHLQYFGNLDGVAKAEGELFEHLAASGGTAFVNTDDARVTRLASKNATTVPYGFTGEGRSVRGAGLKVGPKGTAEFTVAGRSARRFRVRLNAPGRHAASNALAAAAVGLAFGVPTASIASALRSFTPVGKRMETLKAHGVTILNDTYNANTDSMLSALETLSSVGVMAGSNGGPGGRRIAVLADMLEMGKASAREHLLVGKAVKTRRVDLLLAFGPMAKAIVKGARKGTHYGDKEQLTADLLATVRPGDVVLVKGSRGMRMEEIVSALAGGKGKARPGVH